MLMGIRQPYPFIYNTMVPLRNFTGKTEDGYKYRTPKLRLRSVKRIPPPGNDLKIPADLDAETFCRQIGGDCDEISEKFESIDEVFTLTRVSYFFTIQIIVVALQEEMKERGVPVVQRKYIMRCREQLKQGVLTFEYLSRRTCLDRCRD